MQRRPVADVIKKAVLFNGGGGTGFVMSTLASIEAGDTEKSKRAIMAQKTIRRAIENNG